MEDELFLSLTDDGVDHLLDRAVELHGEELVTKSDGANDLDEVRTETAAGWIDVALFETFSSHSGRAAIATKRWQAVALEIAEGLEKAVLLIGSIGTVIVLDVVLATMAVST
jgi:hypothetical protein